MILINENSQSLKKIAFSQRKSVCTCTVSIYSFWKYIKPIENETPTAKLHLVKLAQYEYGFSEMSDIAKLFDMSPRENS